MTSDERREVAERMRALPSDIYSTIKELEKDGLFIDATLCDEADYSQIHNAVFGCFPTEYVHPGDREEFHDRLADLIDPTCRAVHQGTSMDDELVCSECGASLGVEVDDEQRFIPKFCSCCGARVVSGDD